jgi:hypothetical protein
MHAAVGLVQVMSQPMHEVSQRGGQQLVSSRCSRLVSMLPPAFEMALFRRLMTSGRVLPAGQRVHVWFSTKKSEGHCLVSHWVSGPEGSAPAAECMPGAHATQLWLSTRSPVPHALGPTHAPHPFPEVELITI